MYLYSLMSRINIHCLLDNMLITKSNIIIIIIIVVVLVMSHKHIYTYMKTHTHKDILVRCYITMI